MKFLNVCGLLLTCWIFYQTYNAQQQFNAVLKMNNELQMQINKLTVGVKAAIEAEVANFKLDSIFQHFHGNVWVPRDKFLLDKQSKASADKARNLLQALEQFGKIDSSLIQTTITFNDNETNNVSKQSVSFKK